MVTDRILAAIAGVLRHVVQLLPEAKLPTFLRPDGVILSLARDLGEKIGPLSLWVPFEAMGTVWSACVLALGVGISVRAVRMIMSLLSGGGGGA